MKDIKVLFIPDVHCRDFWKEPVKKTLEENPEAKIIFLGDYVDGYGYEFGEDVDYQTIPHNLSTLDETLRGVPQCVYFSRLFPALLFL